MLNNKYPFDFDAKGYLSIDDFYISKIRQLMSYRIENILLVASLYDSFILEEDGKLEETISRIYTQRDLGYVPAIKRVTNSSKALEVLQNESFDLVIAVIRQDEIYNPLQFAAKAKEINPNISLVLLLYHSPLLEKAVKLYSNSKIIDKLFLWRGEGKILSSIIQLIEDNKNLERDTKIFDVPIVLLVEDSIDFYSLYISILYDLLWKNTESLLKEKFTSKEKILAKRGRPRVYLTTNFEEAEELFRKFGKNLLGIIADCSFKRNGKIASNIGFEFIDLVRLKFPNLPIILQSNDEIVKDYAEKNNLKYLIKTSPTLISDFENLFLEYFGFKDLVFRNRDGLELARIPNLNSLISTISSLPPQMLYDYFKSEELKRWLISKVEFEFTSEIYREEFIQIEDPLILREKFKEKLIESFNKNYSSSVLAFNRTFDFEHWHFSKIGEGSMGGKARGLAFINNILNLEFVKKEFENVNISIPKSLVLGAEIFSEFLSLNNLFSFVISEDSDIRIANAFINADFPPTIIGDLMDFIRKVKVPLAIRSSSLLEDALYQPFAGIYITKMLPNNEPDDAKRFLNLINAIKLVYASTFFKQAKAYLDSTNHHIEEEKMAILIQQVAGSKRGDYFYPDISGVAKSYNYYPFGNVKPEDGIVEIALGLGKIIVDGETSYPFIPTNPKMPSPQFSSTKDLLKNSQKYFYAINMKGETNLSYTDENQFIGKCTLNVAEQDGVLNYIGSTYSQEEDRVYDGISRKGTRVINFAHILKSETFPLAKICKFLLNISEKAIGVPVEIEFALSLPKEGNLSLNFSFLQVRPLVRNTELVEVDANKYRKEDILVMSEKVLGNGAWKDIYNIVYVKPDTFDPSKSVQIAEEIGKMNNLLKSGKRGFLLIGPGRWGSQDPWLGIPIRWDQISNVKSIVEVAISNMNVEPSQGSHFFHNIASLRISYFTVSYNSNNSFVDWEWLNSLSYKAETEHVKLIELTNYLQILVDGRTGKGIILKSRGND